MKKISLIVSLSFTLFFSQAFVLRSVLSDPKEIQPAQKMEVAHFKNLYKINDSLYRSEQPTKSGMKELETLGIITVLNFRNHHNDKDEVCKTNLIVERIILNTNKISYADIVQSLKIIQHSKKPILIHCLHGSDRTGCMIAAYRMVFNNYTKEQAIAELIDPKFGYHQTWFPNIIELLNGLDVEWMKKELN